MSYSWACSSSNPSDKLPFPVRRRAGGAQQSWLDGVRDFGQRGDAFGNRSYTPCGKDAGAYVAIRPPAWVSSLPASANESPNLSRKTFFWTLPIDLRGRSATKVTRFGNLNVASLCANASCTGCATREAPRANTPEADQGHLRCGVERGAGRTARSRASCAPIVAGRRKVKTALTAS